MTDKKLLQQDEIDALLKSASGNPGTESGPSSQGEASAVNVDAAEGNPFDFEQLTADDTRLLETEVPGADNDDAMVFEDLKPEEKDALGEIGNISMGSAATTLSQLLNRRVLITSPEIIVASTQEFLGGFNVPFLIIKVEFIQGINGHNVLVIKLHDAMVMANLMMGGDGTDLPDEISEMEISAAAEAMNQMIGTASTSLADLMNKSVNIAPPEANVIHESEIMDVKLPFTDPIVITSFKMNIEDLLDTRIMQILDLQGAREQARLLLQSFGMFSEEPAAQEENHFEQDFMPESAEQLITDTDKSLEQGAYSNEAGSDFDSILDQKFDQYYNQQASPTPPQPTPQPMSSRYPELENIDPEKLNMLLDIPLRISVVLGRTKKSIKDVLSMTPGAIAELETLVDEPVDVLINGKLVAKGEVVVVNENFGVKITSIISQRERIITLK